MKLKGNVAAGYGQPRFGGGMGELFQRATIPAPIGLNVSDPVDQLEENQSPFVLNARSYGKSALTTRPGLTLTAPLANVHPIFHLQDEVNGLFPFVYGAGTNVYLDSDLETIIASGMSGRPLTSVIARPERSPDPWMYIADDAKMIAIKANGTVRKWGIDPPRIAPTIKSASPIESMAISDCLSTTQDGLVWNTSVGAGVLSVIDRVNTTIQRIIFNSAHKWMRFNRIRWCWLVRKR